MASHFANLSRSFVIGAIILAGIAAIVVVLRASPAPAPPGNLEGASIGGPYRLIDEQGQPVTEQSFPGQYKLYYFGFTYCPDICPTDTARLAQAFAAFERADPDRAARVQPLFVSVDPERDTPAALAEFTDSFHPRLIGLTGTPDEAAAMRKAFRVYAQKQPGSTPQDYLVDHAALYYLFDPENRPIAFLSPLNSTAEQVTAMLDAHVR